MFKTVVQNGLHLRVTSTHQSLLCTPYPYFGFSLWPLQKWVNSFQEGQYQDNFSQWWILTGVTKHFSVVTAIPAQYLWMIVLDKVNPESLLPSGSQRSAVKSQGAQRARTSGRFTPRAWHAMDTKSTLNVIILDIYYICGGKKTPEIPNSKFWFLFLT